MWNEIVKIFVDYKVINLRNNSMLSINILNNYKRFKTQVLQLFKYPGDILFLFLV